MSAEEEFSLEKQYLPSKEKARIRNMVGGALEALVTKSQPML